MTYQKSPKKPHELTTDEAVRHLFHPEVVAHAKDRVAEADRVLVPKKKSTTKE